MNKIVLSLRPVAAATALMALNLLSAGGAWAGEDDIPLSLTLAENLSHDTNFSKDDTRKVSETVSTTSAQMAFSKTYGRQTYELGANLSALRYKNFDYLNNDGRNFTGGFTSGLLRDWIVRANGTYDESLNAIQNNAAADRVVKNIRKFRDTGFSIQYGREGSLWALAATYDHNKQDYSLDSQQWQNSTQSTKGLKFIYYASDVLQYSLGARNVVTDYPQHPFYSRTEDRNIDLSTVLQLTGLSNLNATITNRSTTYTPEALQKTKGWTGSLYWDYTPHGILSYNLGFSRTTGSDRQQYQGPTKIAIYTDIVDNRINSDTVTSVLSGAIRAALTGKLSANVGYSLTQFKVAQTYNTNYQFLTALNSNGSASANSYNHTFGLGVTYAALRSVSFRCGYQNYAQTSDHISHTKYTGKSYDCSANFTINP